MDRGDGGCSKQSFSPDTPFRVPPMTILKSWSSRAPRRPLLQAPLPTQSMYLDTRWPGAGAPRLPRMPAPPPPLRQPVPRRLQPTRMVGLCGEQTGNWGPSHRLPRATVPFSPAGGWAEHLPPPHPHQLGQSPPERCSLGQFLKSQLLPGLNFLLVLSFFFKFLFWSNFTLESCKNDTKVLHVPFTHITRC